MLELQSHVCSEGLCSCGCARVKNMLYLKKKKMVFCVCSRGKNLPSDWGLACMGELHDLSCQPFTHNVSFMNVSCVDLIPFRAE